jgi:hypothetical protein
MFGRSRAFGGAAMNSAVTLAAEADTLIPLAEVLQAVVGGTVLVGGLGIRESPLGTPQRRRA